MRTSHSRVATMVTVGLLVASCASAASPTPGLTPSQSPSAAGTPSATLRPTASPVQAISPVGRIAAGYTHTCVITDVGGVTCWGANQGGQLGDGTTIDSLVPVEVIGLESGVVAISAGDAHTCALTNNGGVMCWGDNYFGELGDNTTDAARRPTSVAGLGSGVAAIDAGTDHTCAVTISGGVKCWGYNGFGGLGDGTRASSRIPVDVSGLTSGVSAIAAGYEHTCALTTSGGVKCWGSRTGAELGNGATTHSTTPVDVTGLARDVTALAAGPDFTCAVEDGGLVCWGSPYGSTPVAVVDPALSTRAVAAGGSHACALTGAGGVLCWGANYVGQLGDGSTTYTDDQVDVAGLPTSVAAIAAGYDHTCALTVDRRVSCWGDNSYGQLGDRTPCRGMTSSATPVEIDFAVRPAIGEATQVPSGLFEHATGPTDVVLRFDRGPDLAVGDLVGELFQPGPEFTLYGDGTAIFREERTPPSSGEGPIVRGRPFEIAQLSDEQIQALLRFALVDGGLLDACERYESRDTDAVGSDVFTIRVGGLYKRVVGVGFDPLGSLSDYLRNFDRSDAPSRLWVPDRYWGNLFDASVFAYIGDGVVPGLAENGSIPWPWPGIAPGDFVGRDEGGWIGHPRRVMSPAEASVSGLSNDGGVVQRVYLQGPEGDDAIYYFSLWPMQPDETG